MDINAEDEETKEITLDEEERVNQPVLNAVPWIPISKDTFAENVENLLWLSYTSQGTKCYQQFSRPIAIIWMD